MLDILARSQGSTQREPKDKTIGS